MDKLRKIVFVGGGRELVLPVTPPTFEVDHGIKIETVNIHGIGDLRIAGHTTLDNPSLSSFFPAQQYSFCVAQFVDPYELAKQFEAWSDARTVCRMIVTGTSINMPVLIENIRYGEKDGSNDVYYTLSLSEYRYVTITPSASRAVTLETPRPVTVQPSIPKTHTVASGDTLRSIARKYYGDASKYTDIASANGIKNANVIRVGAVLTLP